mgnify:CR=1 FL=1
MEPELPTTYTDKQLQQWVLEGLVAAAQHTEEPILLWNYADQQGWLLPPADRNISSDWHIREKKGKETQTWSFEAQLVPSWVLQYLRHQVSLDGRLNALPDRRLLVRLLMHFNPSHHKFMQARVNGLERKLDHYEDGGRPAVLLIWYERVLQAYIRAQRSITISINSGGIRKLVPPATGGPTTPWLLIEQGPNFTDQTSMDPIARREFFLEHLLNGKVPKDPIDIMEQLQAKEEAALSSLARQSSDDTPAAGLADNPTWKAIGEALADHARPHEIDLFLEILQHSLRKQTVVTLRPVQGPVDHTHLQPPAQPGEPWLELPDEDPENASDEATAKTPPQPITSPQAWQRVYAHFLTMRRCFAKPGTQPIELLKAARILAADDFR